MDFVEAVFGTLGCVSSTIGLAPQVYKAFKTKSLDDVSTVMLVNFLIGSISWVVYGVHIASNPVLICNIAVVATSITALCQKAYYRKRKTHCVN